MSDRSDNFSGEVWIESDELKGPSKQVIKEMLAPLDERIVRTYEHGDSFIFVISLISEL